MTDGGGDGNLPPGIGAPAGRALANAGIENLGDLANHREPDIAALHGMGPKGLRILRAALADRGLAFASESTCGPERHGE